MRKKLLAVILFAGCGSPQPKTPTPPPPPPDQTTEQQTPPAPTPATTKSEPVGEAVVPTPGNPPAPQKAGAPEYGTWGFDLKGMNTKTLPGRSFYDYANGGWLL